MLDATTKIPSGIAKLNIGSWMGSFDECLEIQSTKKQIKSNYCLGTLYITSFDDLVTNKTLSRKVKLFTDKKATFQNAFPTAGYPSFGLCVPDGCKSDDLQKVVEKFELSFPVSFECQTFDDANPKLTVKAWVVIGFFGLVIMCMIMSTVYDLQYHTRNKEYLRAFSVYTNGKKLFKTQNTSSDLGCLYGIRVLSMIWVIIGHSFSVTVTGPVVNALDVIQYLDKTQSMILANAVHSVDTFLTVTGLLVIYGYMKARSMGTKFNLPAFYIHRYIRLTPPFLAVALVSMALLQYFGSGPHWSFIVNYFQGFCETSWWSSLLYLQNYINVEQWCVGQTWYLNIDWQLYLVSPLFFFALSWRPTLGIALLGSAVAIFIVVPFYITWINKLPALIVNLHGDLLNYQNLYYLKTHCRAAPWFIGAIFGYIISRQKFHRCPNIIKNKYMAMTLWSLIITIIPICIFMGHDELTSEHYHAWDNALYNSLVRPVWGLCIGLLVLLCSSGYGGVINVFLSLPLFQVLNRFTYSIYLLHVTTLYMIIYSSKTPTYFSFFRVAYSFWGITMLTFVLSIFWVLAFESPVLVLEKYYMGGFKDKTVSQATLQDSP